MISRQIGLEQKLSWFKHFSEKPTWSDDFSTILKSLIGRFEMNLMQGSQGKSEWLGLFRILVGFVFKVPATQLPRRAKNTVYIWPFQFLHCDFLVPVIKEFEKRKIPFEVLVFRQNLVPYLLESGVRAKMIASKSRFLGPFEAMGKLILITKILVLLSVESQPWKVKSSFLRALIFLELSQRAMAAINAVSNKGQYHLVGYDLSLIGQIILHETNRIGLLNGRIQNGAPNYLLAGTSEAQEVFFWDDLSAKAYTDRGFQGNTIITGNLLLQRKIAGGFREEEVSGLISKKDWEIVFFVAFSGPGHNTSVDGHQATLSILKRMINRTPESAFVIKLHPKDDEGFYAEFEPCENVFLVEKATDINALDFLWVSDVLITGASTVALDASSMKMPVISIDPLFELTQFGFLEQGNVTKVHSEEDAHRALKLVANESLLENKAFKRSMLETSALEKIVRHIQNRLKVPIE